MLRIRFSRMGRKGAPTYRLVVSERNKDTFGDAKEIVGHYNPRSKEVGLKADRIQYWMSVGAQPSKSVHNLLVAQGVVDAKKIQKSSLTKKRRGKLEEKLAAEKEAAEAAKQAEEEAKKAAEEAAAQAAAEAEAKAEEPPQEEAPAEEKEEKTEAAE